MRWDGGTLPYAQKVVSAETDAAGTRSSDGCGREAEASGTAREELPDGKRHPGHLTLGHAGEDRQGH
jgi:hypothetical protein